MSRESGPQCPCCGTVARMLNVKHAACSCAVFRHPMPSRADLDRLYELSWSDAEQHVGETGGVSEARAAALCQLLASDVSLGGKILDYGAGQGNLTVALSQAGADVTAVDPYSWKLLRQRKIVAFPDMESVNGQRFAGIVASEVIEHLCDPHTFLEAALEALLPNGWLFLTTPNVSGLNARLTRSRWRELQKDGHLILFRPAGIERLLASVGFCDVRRMSWAPPANIMLRTWEERLLKALRLDGGLRYLAYRSMR
jgi:cyclopropane fatty-acyl-phospholipid synthase-like methyltransferase